MCRIVLALLLMTNATLVRADWQDDVMYQVTFNRTETKNGVAELAQNLDQIIDLGATVIDVAFQAPFAWTPDTPSTPDENDLKTLIARAHDAGLKVVLDVTYMQVRATSTWVTDHPDWLKPETECGLEAQQSCEDRYIALQTDLAEVRDAVIAAQVGLAQRIGLDGFRLVDYDQMDPDFWSAHRAATQRQLDAAFFMIAVAPEGPGPNETSDAHQTPAFGERTWDFLIGNTTAMDYATWFDQQTALTSAAQIYTLPRTANPGAATPSPQETNLLRAGLALLMFSQAIPNIPADLVSLQEDAALIDDLTNLIALRQEFPDMSFGPLSVVLAEGDILALQRGEIAVVINRGSEEAPLPVPMVDDWTVLWGPDLGPTLPAFSGSVYYHSGP